MFELDLKSRKPISEQIVDNIKTLVISGVMISGEKLPSVRELASDLTVNPNTVQKAFRTLERQGYIYTSPGRGTFVQDKSQIVASESELKELRHFLEETLNRMFFLGLSKEGAKTMIFKVMEGRKDWK